MCADLRPIRAPGAQTAVGGSVIDDDPDRDPLADARRTLRALQEARTPEHVAVLLALIDGEHARAVLVALALDRFQERGGFGVPPGADTRHDDDLPDDPWEDWLDRAEVTLDALATMNPAELLRAARALGERHLREIVLLVALDRLGRTAEDEPAPDDA